MGPMYWMPQAPTRLRKCSERQTNSCDTTETDGCCAIIPCDLCLEFFVTPSTYSRGEAPFAVSGWSGTIAGATFLGYWEQDYQTGECEFVVAINGLVVYRKSCYEGADCRDPGDSTTVTIGESSGTLTWSVFESRPLEYIQDPDTNCRTYYCDDCDCSCEELCVDVREMLEFGFIDTYSGTISNTAYDCEPPLWEGTIGSFALSLALGRDEYGRCIITPTVNSVEQVSVLAPGCSAMTATIVLEDGSEIDVRCKRCDCGSDIVDCLCGRPLGPTLTLLFASANAPSTVHEVTLTYGMVTDSSVECTPYSPDPFPAYTGSFSGILAIPMGGTRSETMEFMLVCGCTNCDLCLYYKFGSQTIPGWCVTTVALTTCDCPAIFTIDSFDGACDVWSYQIFDITIEEPSSNC